MNLSSFQKNTLDKAPEIKSAPAHAAVHEVAEGFDDFMKAFENFKEANDERLAQLENQKSVDVITHDKVERINQAMDQLLLKRQRPQLNANGHELVSMESLEHKNAFVNYVRSGNESDLHGLEQKAMSATSDADGGFLVPDVIANEIVSRTGQMSPIRSIATVRQVSSNIYKKPYANTSVSVGWVGETDARPETTSPILGELQFPTMELYAMPAATSSLLEDAAIDVDRWLVDEVETAFSEQETSAFINGDGISKPMGFLSAPTGDQRTWSWGNLGYLATGASADFGAEGMDVLVDAIYSVKAGYRQNSNWVMNRKVQAEIRKLKDADGNYIWQAPSGSENNARLLGFPIVEAEDMPDLADNSLSIAFGDFGRGYLIIDRAGVRVLRDPYSSKPYVLFYITKRVGGGIQDFDAIKLVKFGAA